jgi:hypothetical protein
MNRSAKPASCQILAFILAISLEPGVTLSFTSQMLKPAQEMVEMGNLPNLWVICTEMLY